MHLAVITRSWRLHDHPALHAAGPSTLVALDTCDAPWPTRTAEWRARSRAALARKLRQQGVAVLDAAGLDGPVLRRLASLGIQEIHLDAAQDPWGEAWLRRLAPAALPLIRHTPALAALDPLLEGRPALPRSFSAFHRLFEARALVRPVPDFRAKEPVPLPTELEVLKWPGEEGPPPGSALPTGWQTGEDAGLAALRAFTERAWPVDPLRWEHSAASAFQTGGSSGLSPWLAQGDLGPRLLWQVLGEALEDPARAPLAASLRRQLVWRDYALALHAHHPDLEWAPVAAAWRNFPTRQQAHRLQGWKEGRAGIPVVDAAMRQLREEGWMHNRLRMMCGTWLVKQLGQPWVEGLAHFRELLVDWDPALNAMNWQWCAGCGVDAQPWFRLFNPEKQAERADPEGSLLRRWLPELDGLSLPLARRAWALTPLERAGLDYPAAILDPAQGRAEALEAWARFRTNRSS